MKKAIIFILMLFVINIVSAQTAPNVSLGDCYSFTTPSSDDLNVDDLVITESCNSSGSNIAFTDTLDLNALGAITNSVDIGDGFISVDVLSRPDLDASAILTFKGLSFAIEPVLLKDGVVCAENNCNNSEYDISTGIYTVEVDGFSTYNLTTRQDMTVYTDRSAYLQSYIYQTIDFGAVNTSYKCVVMIFDNNQRHLLQSNPERQKREKDVLSISTDLNLEDNSPEYLGYFKSENGLVNTYYNKDLLIGYTEYVYVAKCHTANGVEKVYEEVITPEYWELFKSAPERGIWWTNSAPYAIWVIISGIIIFLIIWYQIKK